MGFDAGAELMSTTEPPLRRVELKSVGRYPGCNFLNIDGHLVRKLVGLCRVTRAVNLNVIGVGVRGHAVAMVQP